MTTQLSIIGNFSPDTGVYLSKLTSQMSLTNVKTQFCWVLPFPTGADLGGELSFTVPQNYSSTPVLVLVGVIDGTPANTFGIGAQLLQVAASATIDAAYEAEDVASNATWTGYADEEMYTLSITLTPSGAFVAGNTVYIKFYRDDSVDTQTIDFLMTDLLFQYTEA
jgi:hypothetical protein